MFLLCGSTQAEEASIENQQDSSKDNLWSVHVEPILKKHCQRCHGNLKQANKLDLRSPESLFQGGKRGAAIVPGAPEKSLLFKFIQQDSKPHMPPDKGQLNQDEIEIISRWIKRLSPTSISTDDNQNTDETKSQKANAEDSLKVPQGLSPDLVIDLFIERGWKRRNIAAGVICDDRMFVRRVFLDTVGRIPTRDELAAFLNETGSNKRENLIDRLIDSDEYARHLSEIFHVTMMGREGERSGRRRRNDATRKKMTEAWQDYLETSFRENRPWNVMAREILLARPSSSRDKAAVWFLYDRKNDHQMIAEAIAPNFFGMQIQCAQCHDHPLVGEILQADYWGLVAIFSRSKNASSSNGPIVSESAIGSYLKFSDLSGESYQAPLAFLGSREIEENRPADGKKEEDSPELYVNTSSENKTVPKFSRREKFVDVILKDNPRLSLSMVNRLWALLMGRGLVHPVDMMDSMHEPSHPELLEWLAEDFRSHGYDIKRLARSILLSRAYQLDSRLVGKAPPEDAFAIALQKPLIGEVFYRSFQVAMGKYPVEADPRALEKFRLSFPEIYPVEKVSNLKQALFLTNGLEIDELVSKEPENTIDRLLSYDTADEIIHEAFLTTLGRAPHESELRKAVDYLAAREDRPEEGIKQLIWALLTGAEFRFNH